MVYLPVIGFTLSQRESNAPSGVKLSPPHDIGTQTPPSFPHPHPPTPLHIGVEESVQSADAEHVVTTAAVANDGASCQRDCEGHLGKFRNWSHGTRRRYTLPLEHVSRTQQALARCTRPLALAQRTQPVLTARKTRLAGRKFMKQATVSYVKFSTESSKYSVNVATHSLKLYFKYVLAEHN